MSELLHSVPLRPLNIFYFRRTSFVRSAVPSPIDPMPLHIFSRLCESVGRWACSDARASSNVYFDSLTAFGIISDDILLLQPHLRSQTECQSRGASNGVRTTAPNARGEGAGTRTYFFPLFSLHRLGSLNDRQLVAVAEKQRANIIHSSRQLRFNLSLSAETCSCARSSTAR